MHEGSIFTRLRKWFESREEAGDRMAMGNRSTEQGQLRVSDILRDLIYFDFWAFFLLLTPFYTFKTMNYVTEKGIIYVFPYVVAFVMIYFKSFVHVKDWVLRKWVDYKDF